MSRDEHVSNTPMLQWNTAWRFVINGQICDLSGTILKLIQVLSCDWGGGGVLDMLCRFLSVLNRNMNSIWTINLLYVDTIIGKEVKKNWFCIVWRVLYCCGLLHKLSDRGLSQSHVTDKWLSVCSVRVTNSDSPKCYSLSPSVSRASVPRGLLQWP